MILLRFGDKFADSKEVKSKDDFKVSAMVNIGAGEGLISMNIQNLDDNDSLTIKENIGYDEYTLMGYFRDLEYMIPIHTIRCDRFFDESKYKNIDQYHHYVISTLNHTRNKLIKAINSAISAIRSGHTNIVVIDIPYTENDEDECDIHIHDGYIYEV